MGSGVQRRDIVVVGMPCLRHSVATLIDYPALHAGPDYFVRCADSRHVRSGVQRRDIVVVGMPCLRHSVATLIDYPALRAGLDYFVRFADSRHGIGRTTSRHRGCWDAVPTALGRDFDRLPSASRWARLFRPLRGLATWDRAYNVATSWLLGCRAYGTRSRL